MTNSHTIYSPSPSAALRLAAFITAAAMPLAPLPAHAQPEPPASIKPLLTGNAFHNLANGVYEIELQDKTKCVLVKHTFINGFGPTRGNFALDCIDPK